MAAVATTKSITMAAKTKKPSMQIQTNPTNKNGASGASPLLGSVKRPPGTAQVVSNPAGSASALGSSSTTTTRPGRRLQRITTKLSIADTNTTTDKKATWPAEPYIITEKYIMNKHRGKPPSLIVHLHPTYFRFDQQEGNFSYQSEMRIFIEHLRKKTIPHDMLEELRIGEVRFYDGWLIVKVVDHRVTSTANGYAGNRDTAHGEEKSFSIHNTNQYITPSPYSVRSVKELEAEKSPKLKQEAPIDVDLTSQQTTRPQTNFYYTALRPTHMSRHIDLMLDFMAPDPKSKKSQKDPRTPGIPQTPLGTVPPTPGPDRPPPNKKQKLRIDPKDYLEYEAKTINSTAPPLYLDPVQDVDEMIAVHDMLADADCQQEPASPKSRKRTTAELAADDAYAKQQERFMLIMDVRGTSNNATNTTGVDAQPVNVPFQPRFEKFNALDTIRRDLKEREQRDKERQLHEDQLRRQQQQRQNDEEEKHRARLQAINENKQQAIRNHQPNQQALAQQQSAVVGQRPGTAGRTQPNAIPLQMQAQMGVPTSSPVIRQGTPNMVSSPITAVGHRSQMVNGMMAGSPRPAAVLQHGHPAQNMIRQVSGQGGPSRNGTPQIPQHTPGIANATPVLRQGTPAHSVTQPSPVGQMQVPTPQMNPAMMQGQIPNNRPVMSQAQVQQELQRRQQMVLNMQNGQATPAQVAEMQARARANFERQAAMTQARANMQATPQVQPQQPQQAPQQVQTQQSSPNGSTSQQMYRGQMAEQMKQQMVGGLPNGQQAQGQGQPPMTPQQMQQLQQARMQQMQAQQAQAQMQQGQPAPASVLQQQLQMLYKRAYEQMMNQQIQSFGSLANVPLEVKQQLSSIAQQKARQALAAQRNMAQNGVVVQNPQQMAMMQQMAAQQAAGFPAGGQSQMQQQMTPQLMQQIQQQQQQQHAQARAVQQQQQQQQMFNQAYPAQMAQMQQQRNLQNQQQANQGRPGG